MVWLERDEQARGAKGAAKIGDSRRRNATNRLEAIFYRSKNPSTTSQERLRINVLTLDNKRNKEAVIDGFLVAHSAKLEPEGDGWLLRYPLARANLQERHFGSVEASLLIIGESRKDALMIAELVLRDHEPPELPTEPTIEPSPPPTKFAMRCSIDPTRGQDRLRHSDMNAALSH